MGDNPHNMTNEQLIVALLDWNEIASDATASLERYAGFVNLEHRYRTTLVGAQQQLEAVRKEILRRMSH